MDFKEPEKEFAINGMVDSFEEDFAIIILKDKQIIRWPKAKLSDDIKEGDSIWFHIACDKDLTRERERIARKILEEILNNTEEANEKEED